VGLERVLGSAVAALQNEFDALDILVAGIHPGGVVATLAARRCRDDGDRRPIA
jgi:hypothetical protein